jgi:hypothetical protein
VRATPCVCGGGGPGGGRAAGGVRRAAAPPPLLLPQADRPQGLRLTTLPASMIDRPRRARPSRGEPRGAAAAASRPAFGAATSAGGPASRNPGPTTRIGPAARLRAAVAAYEMYQIAGMADRTRSPAWSALSAASASSRGTWVIGGAAGDVGNRAGGAAGDVGNWAGGAAGDVGNWAGSVAGAGRRSVGHRPAACRPADVSRPNLAGRPGLLPRVAPPHVARRQRTARASRVRCLCPARCVCPLNSYACANSC